MCKFSLTLDELQDEQQKWLYFLKHGDTMSAAQAQKLGIPEIVEAEQKLGVISQDKILRMQHEQWEKAERDQIAYKLDWIEYGRVRGHQDGEREGKREGKRESIQAILKRRGLLLLPEDEQRIRSCEDVALLDEWLLRAITATSVSEIFVEPPAR